MVAFETEGGRVRWLLSYWLTGIGEQADDDLLVAALAVAVIAGLDNFALFVLAFEVGAGDVVKDDAAIAEMGFGEVFLNRVLTL